MDSQNQFVVQLKDVHKSYALGETKVHALQGVAFDIQKGDFVSIAGPSGSGKTTVLNLIGCVDIATSGDVIVLGQRTGELGDEKLTALRHRGLGFIFQTFNLIGRISVQKNVEVPLMLHGVPRPERKARALKLLQAVDIANRADFSPANISGGERQRVAIARALANDPRIIIADEPTGNLDLKNSDEVMSILTRLNRDGRTIIMVTHNPEITENCSRVIRLRDGRILENA